MLGTVQAPIMQISPVTQQVTIPVVGLAHGGPPSVHWHVPPVHYCVSLQSTAVAHAPMYGAT